MNGNIHDVIEYLKDWGNLLPYPLAQMFCHLHSYAFAPTHTPLFKKHFLPFKNWKHNTFYEITSSTTYIRKLAPISVLNDLSKQGISDDTLMISRIYIVGLTDDECAELCDINNMNTWNLMLSYDFTIRDVYDLMEERRENKYDFDTPNISPSFTSPNIFNMLTLNTLKIYNIKLTPPKQNILIINSKTFT